MRFALALLLSALALPGWAQVEVERPWLRATPPGAQVAGGYLVLHNRGAAPDRLIAVSTTAAERVEMHLHLRDGDVMKMRQVPGFDLPAKGTFELKPGGAHLMFMQIPRPFKEGEHIAVKLQFEKAAALTVQFPVARLGAPSTPSHKH